MSLAALKVAFGEAASSDGTSLICPEFMADSTDSVSALCIIAKALPAYRMFRSYSTVGFGGSNTENEKLVQQRCVDKKQKGVDCCYMREFVNAPGKPLGVSYSDGYFEHPAQHPGFVFTDPRFVLPPGDMLVDVRMLMKNRGIPWLEGLLDVNRKKYLHCAAYKNIIALDALSRHYFDCEVVCLCNGESPCEHNGKVIEPDMVVEMAMHNFIDGLKRDV